MRSNDWIRAALLLIVLVGPNIACAGASRQRTGPVAAGAGSLEAACRELRGSWLLSPLEAADASGTRQHVKASGMLSYDEFGNLTINGKIDDPRL